MIVPRARKYAPGRAARSAAAGSSLLEATVSLAVVSLILILASDLLLEAQRRMLRASAKEAEAPMALVVARLRGDLEAANRLSGPRSEIWTRGSLQLESHGYRLRWRLAGDDLVREVLSRDGAFLDGGTMLRDTALWRWRETVAGRRLVEVELASRRHRPAFAVRSGLSPADPSALDLRRLTVAFRGAGSGEW